MANQAPRASPLRVAYLGTSEFAATVLRFLADADLEIALVVTPPDRRKGRGRRAGPPPAATAATELGLQIHQTEAVGSVRSAAALVAAAPDCAMVCAFGQLIPDPLLERMEWLNVHPSLLPRWRGAAPIERAIMAGDERTGVAIMRVVSELDAGPVAMVEEVPVEPGEDFGSLEPRLAKLGGELAVRALELRAAGELTFAEQDHSRATYAAKIERAERRLEPSAAAIELERRVRALTPHVGAHLALAGGERLGVRSAAAVAGALPVGELRTDEGSLLLGCAEGSLRIARVQPQGGREMAAADYLRGHPAPRLDSTG